MEEKSLVCLAVKQTDTRIVRNTSSSQTLLDWPKLLLEVCSQRIDGSMAATTGITTSPESLELMLPCDKSIVYSIANVMTFTFKTNIKSIETFSFIFSTQLNLSTTDGYREVPLNSKQRHLKAINF